MKYYFGSSSCIDAQKDIIEENSKREKLESFRQELVELERERDILKKQVDEAKRRGIISDDLPLINEYHILENKVGRYEDELPLHQTENCMHIIIRHRTDSGHVVFSCVRDECLLTSKYTKYINSYDEDSQEYIISQMFYNQVREGNIIPISREILQFDYACSLYRGAMEKSHNNYRFTLIDMMEKILEEDRANGVREASRESILTKANCMRKRAISHIHI